MRSESARCIIEFESFLRLGNHSHNLPIFHKCRSARDRAIAQRNAGDDLDLIAISASRFHGPLLRHFPVAIASDGKNTETLRMFTRSDDCAEWQNQNG